MFRRAVFATLVFLAGLSALSVLDAPQPDARTLHAAKSFEAIAAADASAARAGRAAAQAALR